MSMMAANTHNYFHNAWNGRWRILAPGSDRIPRNMGSDLTKYAEEFSFKSAQDRREDLDG